VFEFGSIKGCKSAQNRGCKSAHVPPASRAAVSLANKFGVAGRGEADKGRTPAVVGPGLSSAAKTESASGAEAPEGVWRFSPRPAWWLDGVLCSVRADRTPETARAETPIHISDVAAIMPFDIGPRLTVMIGKNCWASPSRLREKTLCGRCALVGPLIAATPGHGAGRRIERRNE
jgi:hypothetical protein